MSAPETLDPVDAAALAATLAALDEAERIFAAAVSRAVADPMIASILPSLAADVRVARQNYAETQRTAVSRNLYSRLGFPRSRPS